MPKRHQCPELAQFLGDCGSVEVKDKAEARGAMNLQRLRYFESVGRLASFRRAAEELNITQPALSRQIQVLEQEVGAPLLLRSKRRVTLNPAGAHLWTRCNELLDDTAVLLKEVRRIGTDEPSPLTVGVLQSLLNGVFPQAFVLWRKQAGKIPLRVFGFGSPQIVAGVLRGEYDFGIVANPAENRKLVINPLFHDRFVAVLPAGHRLARRTSLDLQSLCREPMVSWPRGYAIRDAIDRATEENPLRTYTAEVESLGAILELVRARLGPSVLPRSAVTPPPRGMVVRPLEGDPISRKVCAIQRVGAALSPVHRRLVDFVTAAATNPR